MSREIAVIIRSDLTGDPLPDPCTTVVALDGQAAEVDLSPDEHKDLQAMLRPYFEAGRKVRPPAEARAPVNGGKRAESIALRKLIREWGMEQPQWAEKLRTAKNGYIPNGCTAEYIRVHRGK